MNVTGIDTQDPAEIGEFEGVLSAFHVLFEVAGQAPVAVGHRAESSLNAPAQRQRGEAIGLRFTCGNLKIDLVPVREQSRSPRIPSLPPVELPMLKISPTNQLYTLDTASH